MKIITRDVPPRAAWALEQSGLHPLLARLFAARGISQREELDDALAQLLPPSTMKGADEAARALADAMAAKRRICIVADYDCDGATACAVGVRGLRLLGAALGFDAVQYLVPDRVVDGYGLTPSIAQRVKAAGADLLVTVDNGIASLDGVRAARELGLQLRPLALQQGKRLMVREQDDLAPIGRAHSLSNPLRLVLGQVMVFVARVEAQ